MALSDTEETLCALVDSPPGASPGCGCSTQGRGRRAAFLAAASAAALSVALLALLGRHHVPNGVTAGPAWAGEVIEEAKAKEKNCNYKLITQFKLHSKDGTQPVNDVRVLTDTMHVISGGSDGNAYVWGIYDAQPMSVYEQGSKVTSVAVMPQAVDVASGSVDGNVIIWDHRTGQKRGNYQVPKTANGVDGDALDEGNISITSVQNFIDYLMLGFSSKDGFFRIYNYGRKISVRLPKVAKSQKEIDTWEKNTYNAGADQRYSQVSGLTKWENSVQGKKPWEELFNDTTANAPTNGTPPGPFGSCNAVTTVPSLGGVAAGFQDGKVRYYSALSFNHISTFGPGTSPIISIAAMQAAAYVFTGDEEGYIRKFHVGGGQVFSIKTLGGPVHSLTVVPATPTLISGSADGKIRMWNLGSGALFCTQSTGSKVNGLAHNPGIQAQFITANEDGIARVYAR